MSDARAVAATIVALLEHEPLTKTELQERLGVAAYAFGRGLATARLAGYVTIRDGGLVELDTRGVEALAAGRANLGG